MPCDRHSCSPSLLFTATTHASGSGQKKRPCATDQATLFRDKQGGKTVRRSKKSTSVHVFTLRVCVTCVCVCVCTVCVRGQCKRETEGIFLERREETCTSTKYIIAPVDLVFSCRERNEVSMKRENFRFNARYLMEK